MEKINLIKPFEGNYPITFKFNEAPEWYIKIFKYPHNGVDFAMPVGTQLLAADNGVVIYADNTPDRDGIGLIIQHQYGQTIYWHTSINIAKYNQEVKKGQIIALSGNTGVSTGPHLHFGLRLNNPTGYHINNYVDPLPYIENFTLDNINTKPIGKTYVVKPGDSLYKIAEKFYGAGYLWNKIYEANKDKIKNPNLIYPLQILRIP